MSDNPKENLDPQQTAHGTESEIPVWFVWVIRLLVAVAIAWGGYRSYAWMMANKPKRERRPRGERVVTVEAMQLRRSHKQVTIHTTGTVVPARELSLLARVSGEIVEVHPELEPGAVLPAGTVAVRIDPTDYELVLRQAEAALETARNSAKVAEINLRTAQSEVVKSRASLAQAKAQITLSEAQLSQAKDEVVTAEYQLALEQGEQKIAEHEWSLIENRDQTTELERELILRKPHLRKTLADVNSAKAGVTVAEASLASARDEVSAAEASLAVAEASVEANEVAMASAASTVKSTEASLEEARLDLARTEVRLPYAVVVRDRAATVGAQISTQTVLANLVAADRFWVEVALPLDRMLWVRVAGGGVEGSKAVVRHSGSISGRGEWQGTVVRLLPELETTGRQARVLVEVADPLKAAPGTPPLLLDTFVKVDLMGPVLEDIFVIPRLSLHNGTEVWLRNGEKRLQVRTVDLIWSDENVALVREGLEEGETLITSDVASAVPGMKVLLPGEASEKKDDKGDPPSEKGKDNPEKPGKPGDVKGE